MLFPVLTSCRTTLKVQTRHEQIASIGMFVSEGDLAPDCRGSMSSRSYSHNHKVIACSFTVIMISILTLAIGVYIAFVYKGASDPKTQLFKEPLPASAWVILSDGGTMRASRGRLLFGGLMCLALAAILIMVLFD